MSSAYWLAQSGIAVAGRTPPGVRDALASTVTSASYLGWRSKRLVTRENLATVLGLPAGHVLVRRAALRTWSTYGRTAASLLCLPFIDLADVGARTRDITKDGNWAQTVRQAMEPGAGTIIATGHFGCWDLGAAMAARQTPLAAIADTFGDARLDDLLQGHRRDKNVDVIPVSGAPRRALQQLRAGGVVAIVADRPVPPRHGVEVTFFGRTAYVPAGAAALAVKSGAAIMPGFYWYAPGNGYYRRAFPPILPRAVSGPDEKAAEIRRLTQYMFTCQEEVVRHSPTQWFMFRSFWPAPGGGAPSAGADRRTSSTRTAPHKSPG